MNILFVSEDFYPLLLGGGHLVIWKLANGLVDRGHNVSVVTRRIENTTEHEVVNGIEIYRPFASGDALINRAWFSVRLYSYLKTFLKSKSIDIIYNHAYAVTMPATLAASKYHIPVVTSVRALAGKASFKFRNSFSATFYYLMEKFIIRFGRHAVLQFPSMHSKKMAESDIKTESLVIYDPINIGEIKHAISNTNVEGTRKLLGIREEELFLLFVGSLMPVKNAVGLVTTLSKLNREFKLIVVGEGPQKRRIEKLATTIGLDNNVTLLGQKPHNETLSIIASCDILILPSHSEQFPNVVVEALALGRPVIATRVGGVPEIKSENLYLVDNLDEITHLLEKGIEPKEDRRVLEEYSMDRIIGEFERLFERMVSQ